MSAVQIVITAWFVLLVGAQIFVISRFAAMLLAPSAPSDPDTELPRALIVLAIRGGDEFLLETLQRLTSLDYPDYILRIVLDSESDSAVRIVDSFFSDRHTDQVEIMYLGRRPLTCSGKIAGLLRGTESSTILRI